VQQRLGPSRPLGAAAVPEAAPDPVTVMLTQHVAHYVVEDRIRDAEAHRLARAARPQRTISAAALRLPRPSWPFAHPRSGATQR
jgi:hypothetical protein